MENEQRRRDSFRQLVEQSPNPKMVINQGRIVYVNRATLGLLGAARATLVLGRSPLDFVLPTDRGAIDEAFKYLLTDHQPLEAIDEQWVRLDGTTIDVEVLASTIDWDGESSIQVTLRDIKSRKEAETWLSGLIEATQDGVISIDRDAKIVMFNPAAEKIFGYEQDEVVGKKIDMLMAEPYAREHDRYVEHYEQTGEKRAIGRIRTVAGRRKNGETFPIELSVTQVATGKEVNYAALIRDISGKVKRERELAEHSRLAIIGATVAKLVHEIGSPLNGMYLTAQVLERRLNSAGTLPDPDVNLRFARLMTELKRLNSMVAEFRSGAHVPYYDFKPVALDVLIREVLSLEQAHYINNGISIDQRIAPNFPAVSADADKFKQVILNLCNNAVEAMSSGGKLTIRADHDRQAAMIEISDTGSGIPADIDIWQPFVTTKKTGTGLGLLIVREIVAAHHGSIDFTSKVGEGTTFRLKLPLKQISA